MDKIYLSSIIFTANQLIRAKEENGVSLQDFVEDLREADQILNNILDEVE